jgi:hypothetical protein
MYTWKWLLALAVIGLATSAAAFGGLDFGLFRDNQLDAHSEQLFGIVAPVEASSTDSIDAETAAADPTKLVTLAKGLHARVVAAGGGVAPNIDMMALWPNDYSPTHLIACNEEGTSEPGLQRIRLFDGFTETIVTGTNSATRCGVRRGEPLCSAKRMAPWAWLIELMNPLGDEPVCPFDRTAGTFSGGVGAGNLSVRPRSAGCRSRGTRALSNGLLYYGDENRPRNRNSRRRLFQGSSRARRGLAAVSRVWTSHRSRRGRFMDFGLGKRSPNGANPGGTDYGQGTNTGLARGWAHPSSNANLRSFASSLKLHRILPARGSRGRSHCAGERPGPVLRQITPQRGTGSRLG